MLLTVSCLPLELLAPRTPRPAQGEDTLEMENLPSPGFFLFGRNTRTESLRRLMRSPRRTPLENFGGTASRNVHPTLATFWNSRFGKFILRQRKTTYLPNFISHFESHTCAESNVSNAFGGQRRTDHYAIKGKPDRSPTSSFAHSAAEDLRNCGSCSIGDGVPEKNKLAELRSAGQARRVSPHGHSPSAHNETLEGRS